MKPSYPVLRLAIVAFASLLIATPTRSYADTYQIVGLGIDNTQFYGMDDAGHVVLYASFFSCGDPSTGCYTTFLNGVSTGTSDVAPAFSWDYTKGACVLGSLPCSITDNGRTASIASDPVALQDLFVSSGSNPPQFLVRTGFGGVFAINGLGDIVFDDGTRDEWSEAIGVTTLTPEPGSFILLATGLLALTIPLRRRVAQ